MANRSFLAALLLFVLALAALEVEATKKTQILLHDRGDHTVDFLVDDNYEHDDDGPVAAAAAADDDDDDDGTSGNGADGYDEEALVVAGAESQGVQIEKVNEPLRESPWKVALIALAAALASCCCCFLFFWYKRRDDEDDDMKKLLDGDLDLEEARSMPKYSDGKVGYLPPDSYDAELFFEDLEHEDHWDGFVQSLTKYEDEYGDCLIPNDYKDPEDSRPLGRWATFTRHLAAANELPNEKIDQLDELGFVWEPQPGDGKASSYGIVTNPQEWDEHLNSLKKYKDTNGGSTKVPYSCKDAEGRALGAWARHQQHRNRRDTLPPDQKKKLNNLGFDWTIPKPGAGRGAGKTGLDPFSDWEEYVASLTEYKNVHGDCLVPRDFRAKDGRHLGQWVTLQRHLYAANELSQDKVDQLSALGFVWGLQGGDGTAEDFGIVSDPARWKQYVDSLKNFQREHGHCNVPYDYVDQQGLQLGKWLHHQRCRYRHGLLPKDQQAELEALGCDLDGDSIEGFQDEYAQSKSKKGGFFWKRMFNSRGSKAKKAPQIPPGGTNLFGPDGDEDWDKHVAALKDYKILNGHCNVPRSYVDENGVQLGEWVSFQRVRNAAKQLPKDKFDQLDALGFVWELQPEDDEYRNGPTAHSVLADWDSYMKALYKYQGINGNCKVSGDYRDKNGLALGQWIRDVAEVAAQNELPPNNREELDALGFDWETHRGDGYGQSGRFGYGRWEVHYNALKWYKSQHGKCLVPLDYVAENDLYLGAWVQNMRDRARREELPFDNFDRITALDFDWQPEFSEDESTIWNQHVQAVKEYKVKYGDADFPSTYESRRGLGLGSWLMNQRKHAEDGVLTLEQLEELEALGIDMSSADGLSPAHMNVHKCFSVTCESCKASRAQRVKFLSMKSPDV